MQVGLQAGSSIRGAIKSIGHAPDSMECGGKRSATPLWLLFVSYPSQNQPLKPKRRRASLAAALHMAVTTLLIVTRLIRTVHQLFSIDASLRNAFSNWMALRSTAPPAANSRRACSLRTKSLSMMQHHLI